MRPFLLVLCCAALGGSFVPNVAPSASRWPLGRDATCHVSGEWYASPCSASSFSTDPGPGPWTSRQMSAHAGDGGGGDTPGEGSAFAEQEAEIWAAGKEIGAVEAKIEAVEVKIEAVEVKIEAVEAKIEAVEAAISGGPAYLGISDRGSLSRQLEQLLKKEEQLRDEMKQLLKKEEQLRDKTKQLRDKELRLLPTTALTPASKKVTDFGAALTGAAVTDNTLELANDTFFLGKSELGSKLFIRHCYKELSEIILSGASSGTLLNIVVTGTPGIGKSLFGFYLLYLLRCQGKTVVFERKGVWYRFSDEGVKRGEYSDFFRAGYLEDDPTAWYLSDPEYKPKEMFDGTTVVLVSPKAVRVNEFLKRAESLKLFMPVWSKGELLKCREAVFSHVLKTDVEKAFGVVGGVARAIFDVKKFRQLKRKMEKNVEGVDVGSLRAAASLESGRISTDEVGDALFHIFSGSKERHEDCDVRFASKFAKDLVVKEVSKKETRSYLAFVGAAINEPYFSRMLGGAAVGCLFEEAAHKVIGDNVERMFNMRMLTQGGSKDMSEVHYLSVNFTGQEEFVGNKLPGTFDIGSYYRPHSQTFAAIDSFGVDRGSDTLYFFQMKYAGVKAVDGGKVEEYWKSAVSNCASIKRCVFVFVVPAGEQWQKAAKIREGGDWLKGASGGFKGDVLVCVIELQLASYKS